MVFHWSLSDSKSLQVSRTLLNILAVLNNTVILDGLHPSANFQVLQSLLLAKFSYQRLREVFHGNSDDSKPLQVSVTLLNILANFSNTVIWMISILPLIFNNSSSFFFRLLKAVRNVPSTAGITLIIFHSIFSSLAKFKYLPVFSLFLLFAFYDPPERQNPPYCKFSFLLIKTWSSLLVEIWWFVCISKSLGILSHFLGRILGCAYENN